MTFFSSSCFCIEFLDDETGQVASLDQRLKLLSDVELNDDTVVEYLLDLSHDIQPKQSQPQSTQVSQVFKPELWFSTVLGRCRFSN